MEKHGTNVNNVKQKNFGNNNILGLIGTWYNMAKPNIWKLIFQVFWGVLAYVDLLIAPIFAAKVINCLYASNFQGAYINLVIGIGILILRQILWYFFYTKEKKLFGLAYLKVQGKINKGILESQSRTLRHFSKEKIMNIYCNDVAEIASVGSQLSFFISKILRAIFTVIAIGIIDWRAMLIVIVINIINFFILNAINTYRARVSKQIREAREQTYSSVRQLIDNKEQIKELNLQNVYSQKIETISKKYVNNYYKDYMCGYHISCTYFSYYNIIAFLITLLLIFTVSQGNLTLENYLIIVPYITTSIEVINDALNFLPVIHKADISAKRVQTLINLPKESVFSGGYSTETEILGALYFNNVSYKGDKKGNPKISNITFCVPENKITLVLGSNGSGRRTILHILRRELLSNKGNVIMGGIDHRYYTAPAYKDNIAFLPESTLLFEGSIKHNLLLVKRNFNKIKQACALIGLDEYINSLPKKYDTDVQSLSKVKKYLLSLARLILLETEIVCLYELPNEFDKSDIEQVSNALLKLKTEKTVLLFSGIKQLITKCDKVIELEDGEIVNISNNTLN